MLQTHAQTHTHVVNSSRWESVWEHMWELGTVTQLSLYFTFYFVLLSTSSPQKFPGKYSAFYSPTWKTLIFTSNFSAWREKYETTFCLFCLCFLRKLCQCSLTAPSKAEWQISPLHFLQGLIEITLKWPDQGFHKTNQKPQRFQGPPY